jgi:hypothetical protein
MLCCYPSKGIGMRAFTVYWNPDTDVTQIKCSESFSYFTYAERVDVLQDAISELLKMKQSIMNREKIK